MGPEYTDSRPRKMSPLQRAKDTLAGNATHRRVAAAESAAMPSRAKQPAKKKAKKEAPYKPPAKAVADRKAKIAAAAARDRAAIAAMKRKKKNI